MLTTATAAISLTTAHLDPDSRAVSGMTLLADANTISLNPLIELICRIGLSVMGLILVFRVISSFAKGDVGAILSSVVLFGVCVWFVVDPSGATDTIVGLTKQVVGAVA